MGKPEGKRPLGRPRHIWEDNIEVDLQEEGCGCMYGLHRCCSGYGLAAGTYKGANKILFHKLRGISRLAENRLASEEGLGSVE